MTPVLRRIVGAAVAVATGIVLIAPAALADVGAVISDTKSTAAGVSGVLTFRSPSAVQVDPSSVVALVDGETVPATISKVTHIKRTAMLVIDTSGSMGPTGMATVRAATKDYLKHAPTDVSIGVVTFSSTSGVDLPPTSDRAAVQRVVNGLSSGGDTSLYAAVRAAAGALGVDGDRSILLLSDGADTVSRDRAKDLAVATSELKKLGIRVDVVRFKTNDADAVVALNGFAKASGGSVIPAANATDVGAAFQSAARALQSQAQFTLNPKTPLKGRHTITISGFAGGQPFEAVQAVDFGTPALPATPQQASQPQAGPPPLHTFVMKSSIIPWVAAATIGLAILLLAAGMLLPSLHTRRERRIASVEHYLVPGRLVSRSEGKPVQTPLAEKLVNYGERTMKHRSSTAGTMQLINRADLPLRAGEWWVLRVVAVVTGAALGILLTAEAKWLGVLVGAVVGFASPPVLLRFLARRRAAAFERLLPQSMMLVSTSLRSGFGLPQALDSIARDSAEPIAKEFSRALAETRIGTDIADALERLAERMGSKSMEMAVMAIRIQREVGGNLAETLETTAKTLRERESLQRQMRTLSAEGRLSAWILIALPIALFLYMMVVNYGYVSLLWTTVQGLFMMVGGIVLMIVGVFWMNRVVKIEV